MTVKKKQVIEAASAIVKKNFDLSKFKKKKGFSNSSTSNLLN
jgi:hypothetical protein